MQKQYVTMNTSIKKGVIDIAKKNLTTPIEQDILETFKNTCSEYGIAMNTILESFMNDFNNGNYTITITKSGVSLKRED